MIKDKRWDRLTAENLTVEFDSDTHKEEVDTWKELFRTDQRYAAKCCGKNGGNGWMNRVLNENQNYGLSRKEMLEAEFQSSATSPWQDSNFLKIAFLEACEKHGLFNE